MSKASSDLLSSFEAEEVEGTPPSPSLNVAPTQNVPIVAAVVGLGLQGRPERFLHGVVPAHPGTAD